MESYYWYDYETFGTDPARDRPAQFAGQRTDLDLQPMGPSLVLYSKPAPDYLPHPDACLITGITPQIALERGVAESDFIAAINAEFSVPATCAAGYNIIRFDDEVTRYTLYRNLLDPYAREWRHGNSRWDLIDVMRMAYALRPEGINWPADAAGHPVFKLDRLTAANGIEHGNAHDALSDVRATIDLARLLRKKQPRLFAFLMDHRGKTKAGALLGMGGMRPVLHASSRFSAATGCLAIIVALARHPANSNGVVAYDLSVDPEPLLSLSPEEIHGRLYTPRAEGAEGAERIALKTVHLNKCPALAPIKALRPEDAERLGLDVERCLANLERLQQARGLESKIEMLLNIDKREKSAKDPDLMLYEGFFSDQDRRALNDLIGLDSGQLVSVSPSFEEPRLNEMLFRYRARNFPETLNASEQSAWRVFCRNRLTDRRWGASLTLDEFHQRLSALEAGTPLDAEQQQILNDLREYARSIQP